MTKIRGKGTFRAQHTERSGRAAQTTALPPRCRDCRLPGTIPLMVDGTKEFFCDQHIPIGGEHDDDMVG